MKSFRFHACWLLLMLMLQPCFAQAIDQDAARRERDRRMARASERIERALAALADAKNASPELLEALAEARKGLKDLDDDVTDIHEQASAPWKFLQAAFPVTAPFLSFFGGYGAGRKHEGHIQKKKRAGGGGADPFRQPSVKSQQSAEAHAIRVEDDPSMSQQNGGHVEMSTASFDKHAATGSKP